MFFKKKKAESSVSFLRSLRESSLFNLILISASNNNESFKEIKDEKHIIEQIFGFSAEETKEFLKNVLEKLIGYLININNDILESLYKLTNGNGYYLSKFIR